MLTIIWPILGVWLTLINLITFLVYGYDKAMAGANRQRVPERTLLTMALIGGALGAWLGMRVFRHKTAKASFQRSFWFIIAAQAVVVVLVFWLSR